jgi:putative oxidoreductase
VVGAGLLLLRLALGLTLMGHGQLNLSRWFGWLRERGAAASTALRVTPLFRAAAGHPSGAGPLAGPAELVGGLLLTLGLLTPLAAAAVVGVAAVAGRRVYHRNGLAFLVADHEQGLLLAAAALATALAFTGPGPLSVDRALGLERAGLVPGVVAVAFGLVGAAAVLGGDHRLQDPVEHR